MGDTILNVARTLPVAFAVIVAGVSPVTVQQPESGVSVSSASVERIRVALQSPQQPIDSDGVPLFAPRKPDEFRFGALTFLPPDTPGQFVRIRVPVGALASRAARSIAAAQHRRAENAARDEVAKALAEFQKAQPNWATARAAQAGGFEDWLSMRSPASTRYTSAMLFMVIENFRDGDSKRVRERFVERGRMLPDDVTYHASWIDPSRARCYQVMEAENADALRPWIAAWKDIVTFEVVPVLTSAEYWATVARWAAWAFPFGGNTSPETETSCRAM
jgi:hypothetical protein